jgi:hypothetical protein
MAEPEFIVVAPRKGIGDAIFIRRAQRIRGKRRIPPGCRATRILLRLCTLRRPAGNIWRRGSAVAAALYAGSICSAGKWHDALFLVELARDLGVSL